MTRERLKNRILNFAEGKKYLNIPSSRKLLNNKGEHYSDQYMRQEFYNLCADGQLYRAGWGWYSTLPEAYELNKSVIKEQEKKISEAFHLLTFSLWSNRQLISHYHHLPTRYPTFLYLESDAMGPVRDYLLGEDLAVYMNPHAPEIEKNFSIDKNPFVLRPRITEEPTDGHFATTEKILVDLFIEKNKLHLMGVWEYQEIFYSITERYRINMGSLLRYGERRKVRSPLQELIRPLTEMKD